MAYNFPNGFNVTSSEPIDARIVMTKEEMYAVKKAQMPSVYFCACSDDGQMYIYNSENDIDSETGRFRLLQSPAIIDKEAVEQIVSDDPSNLIEVTDNGIIVAEYESISSGTINNLFTVES